LKENPYFAESAGSFSPEAVRFLMQYVSSNPRVIQLKAYLCWSSHVGMRNCEIHNIKSRNVQRLAGTETTRRRFRALLDSTKTDPEGCGPLEGK
jgi:hypothetical protein